MRLVHSECLYLSQHSGVFLRFTLTCALLDAGALLQRVAAQLALEVVLPELGEPNVSAVVLQRPAGKIPVETWRWTNAFINNMAAKHSHQLFTILWLVFRNEHYIAFSLKLRMHYICLYNHNLLRGHKPKFTA